MLPLFDSQPPKPLLETVCEAVDEGATIIAANARAARLLRLRHAEAQRSKGVEMWPSAAIFDWDSWLKILWEEITVFDPSVPLLLTTLQERSLWQRVQREDARLVVSPDGMAFLAQAAYRILGAYNLHQTRKTPWLESDAEHFRQWSMAFDHVCSQHNWMSSTGLESRISIFARSKKLHMPKRILLVGFDRFNPAQTNLLHSFRETGSHVDELAYSQQIAAEISLVCADDSADELLACAQWCREILAVDHSKRIGVIVPDVRSIRAGAERIFRSTLMPESINIATGIVPMPFEFSLGVPLATVPVIKAALLIVRWLIEPLPEEEVTWLLLSGFLCDSADQALALAQFDFRQRNAGSLSPETTLRTFIAGLRKYASVETGSIGRRFETLLQLASQYRLLSDTTSHANWSEFVEEVFHRVIWPGFRAPDSVQFQAQNRWQRLLDEVTLLDFSRRSISFTEFLHVLERHANETIFTAESQDAPIQIVGAFESSGQTFDAIWFLGADDSQWPVTARPHPLIPITLQRQAQTPHSSTATDAALGHTITMRISNSAATCIFSYARQNKEGELRPSTLLSAVLPAHTQAVSTHSLRKQWEIDGTVKPRVLLEDSIAESEVTPWPVDRSAGGADVLKAQAACPFQAFATRRLMARPLNRTEWGLNAAERGKLLHQIMEHIWSPETEESFRMTTLDDLNKVIAQQRLDAVLQHHIDNAFRSLLYKNADDSWMQAYFASEQQRLLIRLREWMREEAARKPFEVVAREEKLSDVSVGDLKLNLRADRIDSLPDGTHLLLDYKSGQVSTAGWSGERPDEPQLPLYAVYGNVEDVSGLLFAQIRAGETRIVGRVANAQQQLRADLTTTSALVTLPYDESMREGWQHSLMRLAEEFLNGEASVDPKYSGKTCMYCALPGLCRIAEAGTLPENGDEESTDD